MNNAKLDIKYRGKAYKNIKTMNISRKFNIELQSQVRV